MRGMRGFRLTALALMLAGSAAEATPPLPFHEGGRIIRNSDGSVDFGWPATYFESRFHGTGVSVSLETSTERMRLLIDGVEKALLIQPGATSMTVAGLTPGDHLVRLEKVTESQEGGGRFIGFYPAAGSTPLPPPSRARRIEFIGDSFTVGYGNISNTKTCTTQEVHDRTDSQKAFGPLLARRLDADYRINAYSGFGVVRNYNGTSPGQSLPVIYPRLKPDDPAHVDAGSDDWHPQVIVVNLGTNDFSTPLHAGESWPDDAALHGDYRAKYIAFARGLLARQPQAQLVLMGSDSFYDEVQKVAAALKADARRPVLTLHFGDLELSSCNFHPSAKDDEMLAASLQALLDRHPDVWNGAL